MSLCIGNITYIQYSDSYSYDMTKILYSGGIFGNVRVRVRTVGGGEAWTSTIVPKPGADSNDTIAEILGNRDRWSLTTGGSDYVVMDTEVEFKVKVQIDKSSSK